MTAAVFKLKPLFDRLGAMNLSIVILIVLAIASMIGTVLKQSQEMSGYYEQFGALWFWVINVLGLFDMYHAWWFTGLLVFLTVSLTVCLWRNSPRMIREVLSKHSVITDKALKRLDHRQHWPLKMAAADGVEKSKELLKDWTINVQEHKGRTFIRADKGRYNKTSYIFVHSAILVILLGGLVGAQFGFRGNLSVPEGGVGNTISFLQGGSSATHELPFEVRCNDFFIDFYPSGMPKEFRSNLTIIDDGKEVLTTDIIVNEPLEYKGVRLYQASFGDAGSDLKLKFYHLDGSGRIEDVPAKVYGTLGDGSGLSIEVTDLRVYNVENFALEGQPKEFVDIGPAVEYVLRGPGLTPVMVKAFSEPFINTVDGQNMGHFFMISFSGQERDYESFPIGIDLSDPKEWALFNAFRNNLAQPIKPGKTDQDHNFDAFAAALTEVYGDEKPDNIPELGTRIQQATMTLRDVPWPFLIMLDDFDQHYYTGLQATNDPGMNTVWLGSAILVIGLCFMFYMPHRRLWVVFSPSDKGTEVTFAGFCNRGHMGFDQEFNSLLAGFTQALEIGQKGQHKEVTS
ncbi:MAG: cytochrome c biogenesis protein ResB [Mariprofundaceae bacterium]